MKTVERAGRALLMAALGVASVAASAQAVTFSKPEEAVNYRKGAFEVMERHFSHLSNMALGRIPFNKQQAVFDASTVRLLSLLPYQAFVPGTEHVANTHANDLVWSATPRFQGEARDFQAKAARLPALARSGDIAALKKAVADTGASCRKCHDSFRERG